MILDTLDILIEWALSDGMTRGRKETYVVIYVKNDGPIIIDTNYWQTELAQRGLVFVSVNAGAFRLLMPQVMEAAIEEMKTADYVIITRGTWYPPGSYPRQNAFELLFEDYSAAPYSIHVSMEQVDRLPIESDEGRTDLKCLVYTEGPTLRLALPARYRRAKRLPYLKPWE